MIKVFISVPMRNRKTEDIQYSIRKMKRIARAYLADNDIEADNIDFINTIVKDNPPKEVDERIWYLGASIQLLSKADYLICPQDTYNNPGCTIEKETFMAYKGYDKIITIDPEYIFTEDELRSRYNSDNDDVKECPCCKEDSDIITPDQC